jgi:hypothetical protein
MIFYPTGRPTYLHTSPPTAACHTNKPCMVPAPVPTPNLARHQPRRHRPHSPPPHASSSRSRRAAAARRAYSFLSRVSQQEHRFLWLWRTGAAQRRLHLVLQRRASPATTTDLGEVSSCSSFLSMHAQTQLHSSTP